MDTEVEDEADGDGEAGTRDGMDEVRVDGGDVAAGSAKVGGVMEGAGAPARKEERRGAGT